MLWLMGVALSLTGCIGAGMGVEATLDRNLVTNAIQPNFDEMTDDDLIRLAVGDADVRKGTTQNIKWENARTGDGGLVTYVRPKKRGGQFCRSFVVSKHLYDGISLYDGEICRLPPDGDWVMVSIEERT